MTDIIIKYFYLPLLIVVTSCNILKTSEVETQAKYPIIKSAEELESMHSCDTTIVEGKLRTFESIPIGKGNGENYFDFEIRLLNQGKIPIHNTVIIDNNYLNKKVKILCILECGGINPSGFQDINIKRIQKIITIETLK